MTARKTDNTRSLLVTKSDGEVFRVSGIPSNAKITFSAVNPGAQRGYGNENALRVYTSTSNQLAVFVGVSHFRDESLTVQERKVVKKSAEDSEHGPKGSKKKVEAEVSYEWEESK